jgi:pimeloyl-ACP methyl ester carboxylesterase
MRLGQLTDYFADLVSNLPEKPILIGHSIGGLIVQLLLQRDLASAGVAIHPVAPKGVISFSWSMLKSVWGPLGFFTSVDDTYMMPLDSWRYIFTNGMSDLEQSASYDKFAIPESKYVSRDGLTDAAKIDFLRPHAPLLITSGSTDHIVPAALNFTNFKKYKNSDSVTDYKEFTGRNHFVLGQPTWREDANYIFSWLQKI